MWPTKEQLRSVAGSTKFKLAITAVLSSSGGAVTAYLMTRKRLAALYERIAEEEIAEARQFYTMLTKKEEFATPASAVEALVLGEVPEEDLEQAVEALLKYQGKTPVRPEEKPTSHYTVHSDGAVEDHTDQIEESDGNRVISGDFNVFAGNDEPDEEWNYEREVEKRVPEFPYVITQEEFLENEPEYPQETVTYFVGDDVLVDSKDQPMEADSTVGDSNLMRFGHGSKDNNIVYVRNDTLEIDYEILRSYGKYSREVLGFIEHSDGHKTRRFPRDE